MARRRPLYRETQLLRPVHHQGVSNERGTRAVSRGGVRPRRGVAVEGETQRDVMRAGAAGDAGDEDKSADVLDGRDDGHYRDESSWGGAGPSTGAGSKRRRGGRYRSACCGEGRGQERARGGRDAKEVEERRRWGREVDGGGGGVVVERMMGGRDGDLDVDGLG